MTRRTRCVATLSPQGLKQMTVIGNYFDRGRQNCVRWEKKQKGSDADHDEKIRRFKADLDEFARDWKV